MKAVQIGGKEIYNGAPAFIIAEIGGNFTTLEEGKKEIDVAVECGADAIKVQTYKADTIVTKKSAFTNIAGGANQYDLFKRFELSLDWHKEIFDYAASKNIICFSTPSYYDDVDMLEKLNVPAHKLGSDDLTNLPFIKYVASTKKPLILSTGMSNLEEVQEAVETAKSAGNEQVTVLHCVSSYPVKNFEDFNLRAIPAMAEKLQVPVGFSDHSAGILASCTAVALGAAIIEKHFVLDKKMDTPDAFFSLEPHELKALVEQVRLVEKSLGSSEKKPTPEEESTRLDVRKSLVARTGIAIGEKFSKENVMIKRPGTGIAPKEFDKVIGKEAAADISEDDVISWEAVKS